MPVLFAPLLNVPAIAPPPPWLPAAAAGCPQAEKPAAHSSSAATYKPCICTYTFSKVSVLVHLLCKVNIDSTFQYVHLARSRLRCRAAGATRGDAARAEGRGREGERERAGEGSTTKAAAAGTLPHTVIDTSPRSTAAPLGMLAKVPLSLIFYTNSKLTSLLTFL